MADINHSPFNVGVEIQLQDFNPEEVLELASKYNLELQKKQVNQIMEVVGGHPYLIQKAISALATTGISLKNLITTATTEEGIYGDHLRSLSLSLEKDDELREGMKKVVTSNSPVDLGTILNHKLHSLGLVKFERNTVKTRYKLYADYFIDRLS